MRTLRLSLAGTVMLTLLGGLGGVVLAQEEGSANGVTEEPRFEVTIPPEFMPSVLGKINLERHEVSPGFEAAIGIENEAIRGKTLFVAEGELLVTPMVDAWAWRGGEAAGGTPEVAAAGQPVRLSIGDVIYLPAVAEERLTSDGTTILANPGETTTLLLGHHAHDSSIPDRFPGWPSGMTGTAVAVGSEPDDLTRVMEGDAVYRLSNARFAPGESITPDEDAAIFLAQIESGVIGQRTVGPGGEVDFEWPAGSGLSMDTSPPEGVTYAWTAANEEPLELLILSVTPVASQEPATTTTEEEADAAEEAGGMTVVTGTEVCGARTPWPPQDTSYGVAIRGSVATCQNTMSDARVSGSWLNTMNMDCYGDEFCITRGTHVLDGPDGGWDCTWIASDFPVDHEGSLIIGTCPGTGDYEGLTYVFQHTSDAFEDGTSFHGAIYEGAPLVGPSLEVPAE